MSNPIPAVPTVRHLRDELQREVLATFQNFEARTGTRVVAVQPVRFDNTGVNDTSSKDFLSHVMIEVAI